MAFRFTLTQHLRISPHTPNSRCVFRAPEHGKGGPWSVVQCHCWDVCPEACQPAWTLGSTVQELGYSDLHSSNISGAGECFGILKYGKNFQINCYKLAWCCTWRMDVREKEQQAVKEVRMKNWMVKSHPIGGEKIHLHTLLVSAAIPPNTLGTGKVTRKWWLCGVRGEWEFKRGTVWRTVTRVQAEHWTWVQLSTQGWTCAVRLSLSSCCVGSGVSQALWVLQLGNSLMRTSVCPRPCSHPCP